MGLTKLFSIALLLLLSLDSNAQNIDFEPVLNAYETDDYKVKVYEVLKQIDTTKASSYDKATLLYYFAEYYNTIDKHALAYNYVLDAKRIFLSLEEMPDVSDCNMLAISILSHQNELKGSENLMQQYINEELSYLEGDNESLKLANVYFLLGNRFLSSGDRLNALKQYKKAKEIYSQESDSVSIADCYENMATAYLTIEPIKIDSSLYFTKRSEKIYFKFKNYQALAAHFNNQSRNYRVLNDYEKSISYLLKADSLPLTENVNKTKLIFYENLAEVYGMIQNYEQQAYYLNKQLELRNSINDLEQNVSISEIEEKYQNEKLRADNLEIESKRKQNRNIAIALGSSIILLSVIAVLFYNNRKRKQELVLQEEYLRQEKLKSRLKEQELKSIDAMIEGQELERQTIANELHDDLGSLMTTIQLHFASLKTQGSTEIYQKTKTLIENAYHKIRSISHTKHSSVLGDKGLIKALKDLAKTVSVDNTIQINIYDNGMDKTLSHSQELTVFRIIQELITNGLKHAKATHIDVHLNMHDNELNILVEDDGIGFEVQKTNFSKKGIGISSIEKRVDNMHGTLMIESVLGKGTSIIINVPIT